MRVTYPVLNIIQKNESDRKYTSALHKIEDHNRDYHKSLHIKKYYNDLDIISLYNRQADMKRYDNRTHIDIFV